MWWQMGKRCIEPELMDHADPEDARACLRNLVQINDRFGGHAITRKLLRQAGCGASPFTLLDVGAASGDTARIIRQDFPHATVVSLDQNAVNLEQAPRPRVMGDAFRLPFSARSFDYVFCSLFLHHFTDEQIVSLLRSFGTVARKAVLVSDLERHIVPYLFLPATRWIFRWHWMTVHDGKISVRAALTAGELQELANRAGLRHVRISNHRPAFRLALTGEAV